mgnify:CR=1 FL=1
MIIDDITREVKYRRIMRIMWQLGFDRKEARAFALNISNNNEKYTYFWEFLYYELKPYFYELENENIELDNDEMVAVRNDIRKKFENNEFADEYLKRLVGVVCLSIKTETDAEFMDRLNSHLLSSLSAFMRCSGHTVIAIKSDDIFLVFNNK